VQPVHVAAYIEQLQRERAASFQPRSRRARSPAFRE